MRSAKLEWTGTESGMSTATFHGATCEVFPSPDVPGAWDWRIRGDGPVFEAPALSDSAEQAQRMVEEILHGPN
jgi:hypothetical protein